MRIKWSYIREHLVTVITKSEILDDGELASKLIITGVFDKKLYYQERTVKVYLDKETPNKLWTEVQRALEKMEKRHQVNQS